MATLPLRQRPFIATPAFPSQLFSSCSESFRSFSSSLLLLLAVVRGSVNLRLCLPEPSGLYYLFCASYIVLEMWIVLRLFAAVLVHRYREMNFELYRPAFEPQDYEMVELFVRRLKLWMGFSKVKEVGAQSHRAPPSTSVQCASQGEAQGSWLVGPGPLWATWGAWFCSVSAGLCSHRAVRAGDTNTLIVSPIAVVQQGGDKR